jgi:hypothetical protein
MANKWLLSLILVLVLPVAGLWWWLGFEERMPMLGILGVASIAVGGALWYRRIRAQRRWQTTLDVYAQRTLAQHGRQRRPKGALARTQGRSQTRLPTVGGKSDSYRFPTKEGFSHARAQS